MEKIILSLKGYKTAMRYIINKPGSIANILLFLYKSETSRFETKICRTQAEYFQNCTQNICPTLL